MKKIFIAICFLGIAAMSHAAGIELYKNGISEAEGDLRYAQTASTSTPFILKSGDNITGPLTSVSTIEASIFYGDGSALTGIAGGPFLNAASTAPVSFPYAINSSSNITAAYYQINGSTVLASRGPNDLILGKPSNLYLGDTMAINSTGTENVFIGLAAGANTNSSNNTLIGFGAGFFNTSGEGNTFIGHIAGANHTTGNKNTFIGGGSGQELNDGSYNTFVGEDSGSKAEQSNNTAVGHTAGRHLYQGLDNTFVGRGAGYGANSSINSYSTNTAVGVGAGANLTSGYQNTLMGYSAGGGISSGYFNTYVGVNAGVFNNSGFNNTFLGARAGLNSTNSSNTFVGANAGINTTTGFENSFFGIGAGTANNIGVHNTFIGVNAGYLNGSGSSNTYVGTGAGVQTGLSSPAKANVALGFQAGLGAAGTSYSSNTLIGYKAGLALQGGSNNLFLGYMTGTGVTTGNNNIIIGNSITGLGAATNSLNIGNLIMGVIGGSSVTVQGNFYANNIYATTGFYGDGSNITGVPNPSPFTNAIATTAVRMDGYSLTSSSNITAAYYYGDGSNITGIANPSPFSNATATTSVSMDVYSLTSSSNVTAAYFYGNGSNLTALHTFVYASVYSTSAAYYSTTQTAPNECITGSTLTFTANGTSRFRIEFSGSVKKTGSSELNMTPRMDGAILAPFTATLHAISIEGDGGDEQPCPWSYAFIPAAGTHNVCIALYTGTGTVSIPQHDLVTFSVEEIK